MKLNKQWVNSTQAQFTCEISLVDKLDLTNVPNSVYVAKFDHPHYHLPTNLNAHPHNNQILEIFFHHYNAMISLIKLKCFHIIYTFFNCYSIELLI